MERVWRPFPIFLFLLAVFVLTEAGAQSAVLRRGFRELQLGVTFDDAKTILGQDRSFSYRGEPDLSISLSSSTDIIDASGNGFINRVILQFDDERLTAITLNLDQWELDYFQMYRQLEERYGAPADINPHWAMWQDSKTRILLERPLTISFLDAEILQEGRERGAVESSISAETREQFLEEF